MSQVLWEVAKHHHGVRISVHCEKPFDAGKYIDGYLTRTSDEGNCYFRDPRPKVQERWIYREGD